jgi:multicomponent Na+:H+ antiporter subunit F
MKTFLIAIVLVLITTSTICLYRAVRGPTMPDRILAINVVGLIAAIVLVIVSYVIESYFYLDVAMIYALLNFAVTVALSRFLESEGWSEK